MLVPWLAWALVRTFGLEHGSRITQVMTFTPYVGLTAPLPLVMALLLRRWVLAAVGAAVVVAFALALLPRAFAGPRPAVADGVTVHVMTSNLYVGRGDARTVVDLVRRHHVDVLSLVELPHEEVARLDAAGLRRELRYRDVDARPGANGSGLFSRYPLRRLKPYNKIDQNAEPRVLVAIPGAAPIDVQAIHPPPPLHDWTPVWRTMLRELPLPAGDGRLHMLMGDFNATIDHHELRRLLQDGGYVDAGDATGAGYRTTWPAGRRFPPEITIDHVLLDPRMRARDVTVRTVPGSDHRAVIVTLRAPRVAARR